MAVRKILQIGDPRLTTRNELLDKINPREITRLIADLKDTLVKKHLIGIAAPQIGINMQIFITNIRATTTRKGINDKLRVYINPKITYYSADKIEIYEGCGSVARGTLFGPVDRPRIVEIEAFDETNTKFRLRTNGILARVIQHEYDHLHSTLFTQLTDLQKLLDITYYKKFIRNSAKQLKDSKITLLKYSKI